MRTLSHFYSKQLAHTAVSSMCFALAFIAVGFARPNHLAVLAMCIPVSWFVTTELVSLGRVATDIDCARCTWVEIQ